MCRAAGRSARVTVQGQALSAVFRNGYSDAGDTETRVPQLTCPTVDVERLQLDRKGASVDVDGKTYRIRRHEPDGTGMSRLILES
jgi:hypothetical protein